MTNSHFLYHSASEQYFLIMIFLLITENKCRAPIGMQIIFNLLLTEIDRNLFFNHPKISMSQFIFSEILSIFATSTTDSTISGL